MPRVLLTLFLVLVVSLVLLVGCQSQEETSPGSTPSAPPVSSESTSKETTLKRQARIVVPPEVQGKWQAVKIEVEDKERNTKEVYSVAIGGEVLIPDTDLRIQVTHFLPAFIMDGTMISSASNETSNPGAHVIITEGDKDVFSGWLFSLYPGAHPFQHPRFGFTLVDFVAAE